MDYLPIAVLAVFVLLGGIIAVIADELGRRIGKRRLSLHRRIRPKYTAKILTFLWGVFITLFTMVLIAIASSDMRTLLLHGRKAIDDLKTEQRKLVDDNSSLHGENDSLRADNVNLTNLLSEEQKKLRQAEEKRNSAQSQATTAEARASAANKRAMEITAKLARLQTNYDKAKRQLTEEKKLLDTAAEAVSKGKAELAKLQKEKTYLYDEYKNLTSQNNDLTIAADKLRSELARTDQQIKDKNQSIQDLNAQMEQLTRDIGDKQAALDNARADLEEVQRQQRIAETAAGNGALAARFSQVLILAGEEVARVPIPAGTSKDEAREKIETALLLARDYAKSRGAKPWNGMNYAGMLVDPLQGTPVETQKDIIASRLAGLPDDEVLIAYAAMNAFAGESVAVTFSFRPNPIVYQPNQVLAEIRVDGRQDGGQILKSLDTLGSRLRERALRDKMIPIQRPDSSIGSVSSEDILRLLSEIQRSGGSVRVQAKARRLTRAADPLILDFEVK
ncbi:MAG TPA: DUF3084 domain-containing protein [Fimbriimonadaceae bacterium]|nr:DUF3084 domain-containing protein [Fimbriimonadaceae bacterium]